MISAWQRLDECACAGLGRSGPPGRSRDPCGRRQYWSCIGCSPWRSGPHWSRRTWRTGACGRVSAWGRAYLVSLVDLAVLATAIQSVETGLAQLLCLGADVAGTLHHAVDEDAVLALDVQLPLFVVPHVHNRNCCAFGREYRKLYSGGAELSTCPRTLCRACRCLRCASSFRFRSISLFPLTTFHISTIITYHANNS